MNCDFLKEFDVLHINDVVQVITDYTIQRIGKIKDYEYGNYLLLDPMNEEELKKIIFNKDPSVEDKSSYSVQWPILMFFKNIKEVIILQRGEN